MVVTVGFFDGVHLGHRRVLRSLLESGEPAAVITFWPHPRTVLQQDARDLFLLNSKQEKTSLINSIGIENIHWLDFTKELAAISAEEFVRNVLVRQFDCTKLVLGYDNRLGSDSIGGDEICSVCEKIGIEVQVVPPCIVDDIYVSSTCIRNAISSGEVALADKLLGYRYGLDGIVGSGNRRGRQLGFPTANIKPVFPLKLVPGRGVYATQLTVGGKSYRSMTNIGVRPTFGSDANSLSIETNIFDFDEDIYGLEVRLDFIARIRDEKKFDGVEQLKDQLKIDKHRSFGFN